MKNSGLIEMKKELKETIQLNDRSKMPFNALKLI